ncbi:MAG TPA: hypothetical protein PKW37_07325, partial [Salinivirgaceae bacterium]|nr:hypothetical protein [Salinivirgaceae bacterium]
MKIKSLLKTLMTFAILSTTANLGLGQVSLSGTSYSETFDSISSGLPEGWTVRTGATDTALGETKILATSPTSWSHITGAFKNVASADGLEYDSDATAQENSADRALGVRQTGSFGDPGAAFVFHIANTEGLANFVLEFKLQSLHVSSPRKTTWLVDYGFGSDPTEFTPVTTLPDTLFTGNLSFTNTQVQVNFGNALNNKSENVWIRIVTLSSSSGSSSRATTGIDDFQLNWTTASSSYIVNYSVFGSNGSLSATVDGSSISSGSDVESNKNVVFTAQPDAGYKVKEWKNNGTVVSGNTTNSYTVENLSENINVTVEFELIQKYTLTINIVGNGSVIVNGSNYTMPMLLDGGSEVALSAVATAPWSFDGWTGGLVSTNSNDTVTINSDITITATFIQLPETIVEWTFPVTGEDRLASGGIDINLGRMISRESEFTGNYSDVEGNGTRAVSSTKWEDGADSKYWIIDFATTGYENIILSSKQQGSNKGPRDFKVQVKIDGTDWIDVDSSEIIVANNFTSGVLSDIALPEICNNQGKVYLRWLMTSDTSVNGSTVTSVGANRIDNIIIKGNVSASSHYSVMLAKNGLGQISPDEGVYSYNSRTSITLQAIPDEGQVFDGWTGDFISNNATETLLVDDNKVVTANFRPFASATIDPVSGDLYEETEYLSTVITWNDANEVISITANQSILIQGEDYTITDIDGNTATLTFNVVEFIISKSIKEAEEILCEISFDVGASSIYTIYNYSVPQFYVTFN